MNYRRNTTFVALAVIYVSLSSLGTVLELEKARIGAGNSWADITLYLQDKMEDNSLSTELQQPFGEIGGDPAPGQTKALLINYKLDSKPFELVLEEKYPVAFKIKLPSPDAQPPGTDPRAEVILHKLAMVGHAAAISNPALLWAAAMFSVCSFVISLVLLWRVEKLNCEFKQTRRDSPASRESSQR